MAMSTSHCAPFEGTGGPRQQLVESLACSVVGEAGTIGAAIERQDDLQFPTELQRDFSSDLVGTVGDGRYEPQLRRSLREAAWLGGQQSPSALLESLKNVADPFTKNWNAAVGQDFGTMARHPDGEHEGRGRRPGHGDRCASSFKQRGGGVHSPRLLLRDV